jgi:hypothetical protein
MIVSLAWVMIFVLNLSWQSDSLYLCFKINIVKYAILNFLLINHTLLSIIRVVFILSNEFDNIVTIFTWLIWLNYQKFSIT